MRLVIGLHIFFTIPMTIIAVPLLEFILCTATTKNLVIQTDSDNLGSVLPFTCDVVGIFSQLLRGHDFLMLVNNA